MDPRTEYLGLRLPHPLVVGALPLTDDLDMARRLEDAGAGRDERTLQRRDSSMTYLHLLALISIGFVVLERLFPWRKEQRVLRAGWPRNLGFFAVNGHVFSLWTAALNGAVALGATRALHAAGVRLAPLVRREHTTVPVRLLAVLLGFPETGSWRKAR